MYFKPKKRLGQNFLVDKNIQRKLITSYQLEASDIVLEIGAGGGELTKLLADNIAFVYALEIDTHLYDIIKENMKGYSNLKIINQDILRFNLKRCLKDAVSSMQSSNRLKVVGNIPYYITTPIIEHLFKYRNIIETIYITVQKEFAKRIVAGVGSKEYGSFSCFVQYYAITKIIFFIKKTCFLPPPKVDSCLLQLQIRKSPAVKIKDEKLFFRIIRAAFNKRRKTLRNSLEGTLAIEKLPIFFKKYNIDSNIRPEDLSLQDFANLTNL